MESQGLWQSKGFIEVPFSSVMNALWHLFARPQVLAQSTNTVEKYAPLLTGAKACGKTELGRQLVVKLDRKYWFCI